jgi:cytochrome c556|uniref:Cytochrome c n=1 Tax=Schlesneria paludicola TaxID=360056 RepID=A0A7C4QMG6_9PLAN
MKKLAGVVLALAAVGWLSVASHAQVTKGKSRLALTKQLMAGLVRPNCAGLGDALKQTPADDKAWDELAIKAALLNEAGYLLMDDGRCPDAVWAGAAKTLREASAEVLAKIEAKDQAGAQSAFANVTKACAECHKAHKK